MNKTEPAWPDVEETAESLIRAGNNLVRLELDLEKGEFSCSREGFPAFAGLSGSFRWNGREYSTTQYKKHSLKETPGRVEDSFGKGIHLAVVHETEGFPDIEQHFWLYAGEPVVLSQVIICEPAKPIANSTALKTNKITVLQAKNIDFADESDPAEDKLHALRVPYDNDKWVRYRADSAPFEMQSYEVTALFKPQSRQGVILGSLSHDLWKTGIKLKGDPAGNLEEIALFGGAADEMTRDSQPHGYVSGPRVESPLVLLGFYEDYRDGLEAYGHANARIAPALPWEGSVPFGWNSWSASMSTLDYDLYTSTSDFLKQEVQPLGFENNSTLYINFDAFWNNLTSEEMEDALKRVRNNGHKPGTYWTPFAFWGSPAQLANPVEGTDGKYCYGDIVLRDAEGEILPDIAGGLAIDPTHPGCLQRIDHFIAKFLRDGFEYIKLDFMAHGALEGKHFNPAVTTGIAAYNYGLSYLAGKLAPDNIGRPFFINLSIAPMFPHRWAHSRRISCDVFGMIHDTEYLLNSVTHGWWMNDSLYRFNDPDHTVLYRSFNQEPTTRNEGRSRLTASIIAGTMLLLGDNFGNEEAAWRAKQWLGNQEVIALARLGKTFRPAEGHFGDQAADAFVLPVPGESGSVYLALFNFDPDNEALKQLQLNRLGLNGQTRYRVRELWEGTETEAAGSFAVNLEPAESKIFLLKEDTL